MIADKTVDFCTHPDSLVDNDSVFNLHIKFNELTFSGLVHKCPYTQIKVDNGRRQFLDHSWPSGKYKTITTIMDKSDDKIFEVIYYENLHFQ